jgi:hypothetical protein
VRVVAAAITDPEMFVRRHVFIMHPLGQSEYPFSEVRSPLNSTQSNSKQALSWNTIITCECAR